jgi:hypothetical protein
VAEPGGRTPDLLNAIRGNRSTLASPRPFSSGPNRLHFKDFRIKPGFQITQLPVLPGCLPAWQQKCFGQILSPILL